MIVDLNDLTADFIDTSTEAREWAWSELRVSLYKPKCVVMRYKGDITGVMFYEVDGTTANLLMYASNPPWRDAENSSEIRAYNSDMVFLYLFDTLGATEITAKFAAGNKRSQGLAKHVTGQTPILKDGHYEVAFTREQYVNK